ncbi:hypothetical protein [Streptomyces sioyaensis]|uniref:hypothetical protein n=1 Tax=Streptomyces sioyaensis TaxID=67364 RepID=UPI0036E6F400
MPLPNLKRQFVWTAIPAGRVAPVPGGSEPMALLSVLLTPRLLGPDAGRLSVARYGLQSWPQRLAAVRFDVFRAQSPVPSSRVPHLTAEGRTVQFSLAEQLAAWEALFPGDLLVRPYRPTSYDGREVREFPASQAAEEIRGVYTATAHAQFAYAEGTPGSDARLREELRRIGDTLRTGLRSPAGGPAESAAEGAAGPAAGGSALARAYAFYRREGPGFTPLAPDSRAAEEREFHTTVAGLADHPLLLRALGLLIDLAVPAARLGPGGAAELRVVPGWPSPDPGPPPGWNDATQDDVSPRTAYVLDGQRFVPASTTGPVSTEFKQGLLPVAGTDVAPSGNPRFEVMPFDVDGAALRLVGTAESDLAEPSSSAGALPALRSMGFALVDRDREAEHGRQLRRAQQRATPAGLLSPALTADSLLGGYRMDILDVAAQQWYSLCQRRVRYTIGGVPIGQALTGGDPLGLLEEGYLRPAPLATGAGPDDALFLHQAVARWDGWSPAVQRPERVVDTGDTMPAVAPAQPFEVVAECEPGSLPRLRFGREYRLRVRIADLAGGGLHGDEVRPGEEQSDVFTHHRFEPLLPPELVPTCAFDDSDGLDRMVIRSDRDTPPSAYAAAHGYRAYDLRHLLAPKCSLELAMQHDGAFDAAMGPGAPDAEVRRLFEVAQRADLDVRDIPHAQVIEAGTGSRAGSYVILPEDGVAMPWLADPAATHVILNQAEDRPIDPATGLPGTTHGLPKVLKWQATWPGFLPVKLHLVDAASGCKVTKSGDRRTLIVALGPAEQVTLAVSSGLLDTNAELFGVMGWLGITPDKGDPEFQHILAGLNRLITPPRTVTLVHAVQRPRHDPGGLLTPQREAGGADTLLNTRQLDIDIPGTGRIDISAKWTDQEDRPPAAPAPADHAAHVGSYEVRHLPPQHALPPIRQEFGDTRHHHVSYTVTGISRFEDCFTRALAADPRACLAEGTLKDTDVPSTVRPPVPKLLYTVPTFRWTQTVDDGRSITRLRQGGGVRVFLERPWFASGNDEALAVLTWPVAPAPGDVLRYVSVAGRDPVRDTGAPPAVLTHSQVNASLTTQVNLPEPQRTLDVLAHTVQFDQEYDRWYADIDLSPLVASSYFPFVRLALARYQPFTMAGVPSLSPALQTEPVQLPPHRRLVVTRTAGQATVMVDGIGPGGTAANVIRTELQATSPASAADPATDSAGWTTVFRTTAALGQTHRLDIPASGDRPLRVVVQEFETYPPPADPGSDSTGRMVYADIVPLDAR